MRKKRRQDTVRVERSGAVALITRHRGEFVGLVMATAATAIIFVNALFLQKGPHPAPIFATRAPVQPAAAIVPPLPAAAPPAPRVIAAQPAPAPAPEMTAQARTQLTIDIQRELNRRGYYDGAIDGLWGARTDAAARDFVQASGAKVTPEASEALLRALAASNAKAPAGRGAPRNDPIAALIAPSKRVSAIQRALVEFGYGQFQPSGVYDPETRAAIEKFERDRRLPVTGQMSETVIRELAAMTGRPLE